MQTDQQLELYATFRGDNLTDRSKDSIFAPSRILNHKYYLEAFPQYYFIVRKDKYSDDEEDERVCVFKDGEVAPYLRGNEEPFTNPISNEPRDMRRIETIYRQVEEKISNMTATDNRSQKKKKQDAKTI